MAGAKVILAVEQDAHAVECYQKNFVETDVFHGDIKLLSGADVLRRTGLQKGELDILDGSPPCQGFSTAGKRNKTDLRNELYQEYVRLLTALQPKAFVMENVSGMIKGQMKLVFADILKSLKAAGYNVRCKLLNAKHYGTAQSRERVIFIGFRSDLKIEPNFPTGLRQVISFREAVKGVPESERVLLKGRAKLLYPHILPGKNGGSVTKLLIGRNSFFNLIRLAWDKPAPTIPKTISSGRGGVCHPDEARLLTIAECKRVGGFPDDFILTGSFTQQWARIGNSVPPPLMRAIARSVIEQLP